jgi:phospholipid/cholesterol/gamma-HCH transport system ATP-binding protein
MSISEQNSPMVSIREMHFSREDQPIFCSLCLDVPRYKITAIMGPSGTGKTTLLQLIGAQLQPDSGEIYVNDQAISKHSHNEIYKMRRKMGVLFQGGALFTDLNVYENVAFPLREHTALSEDMINDLVFMLLEAVGLRGGAQLRIDQLSGGMARRVALARSVVLGPELMMYDEPFTGQDPIARGVLLKLIKTMNDALHITSLVVSHDVEETLEIADYIYIISEGRVVGEGVPEALLQDDSPLVKQFLAGQADGPIRYQYPAQDFQKDLNI